jgi:hypothetical protein
MIKIYDIVLMSIPYILFYSNGCNYCTELINTIRQHAININYFCIDGILNLPNYVEFTPTLRVIKNNERYIISGATDIHTWLQSLTGKQLTPVPQQVLKVPQGPQQVPQQGQQQLLQQGQPRRQERPNSIQIEEEDEISYQTTGANCTLDDMFGEQNTDNAEAELNEMFKNKPVSSRLTTPNGNFEERMANMEASRQELDASRETK